MLAGMNFEVEGKEAVGGSACKSEFLAVVFYLVFQLFISRSSWNKDLCMILGRFDVAEGSPRSSLLLLRRKHSCTQR